MRDTDDQLIFEKYQQINEISDVMGSGQNYSVFNRLKSEFGKSKLGQKLGVFSGAQGTIDTEKKANELVRRLQQFAGQTGQSVESLMKDPESMSNWLNQQMPQVVGDNRTSTVFDGAKYVAAVQGKSPHDFFTNIINDTVKKLSQLPAPQASQPTDASVAAVLDQLNTLNNDPNITPDKKGVIINAYNSINKKFKGTSPTAAASITTSTAPQSATPAAPQATQPAPVPAAVAVPAPTAQPAPVPAPTAKPAGTAPKKVGIKRSAVSSKKAKQLAAKGEQEKQSSSKPTTEAPKRTKTNKAGVVPPQATRKLTSDDVKAVASELKKCLPGIKNSKEKTFEVKNILTALGIIPGTSSNASLAQIGSANVDRARLAKFIPVLASAIKVNKDELMNYFKATKLVEYYNFIDCRLF